MNLRVKEAARTGIYAVHHNKEAHASLSDAINSAEIICTSLTAGMHPVQRPGHNLDAARVTTQNNNDATAESRVLWISLKFQNIIAR